MTSSLDLDFVKPRKTDRPGPPRAHIYVKSCSIERNLKIITPDCVCIEEFEYEIDRFKKELDEIRKKAKRKFSSTK